LGSIKRPLQYNFSSSILFSSPKIYLILRPHMRTSNQEKNL
jgi:hypothetical protein